MEIVDFEYDQAATDFERIQKALERTQPKLVTLVHCETPSGILNPLLEIGNLVKASGLKN